MRQRYGFPQVPAYARAMPCPVSAYVRAISLRVYDREESGTDLAYDGTTLVLCAGQPNNAKGLPTWNIPAVHSAETIRSLSSSSSDNDKEQRDDAVGARDLRDACHVLYTPKSRIRNRNLSTIGTRNAVSCD
eukprot:3834388-Rhodomonas_salina.4